MIIGHFLLAFTIVAAVATVLGYSKDKAFYLAIFAGFFAVIPDVDMLYGAKGLVVALESGLNGFPGTFWNVSNRVHRGLSHSIVTGLVAALGFTAYLVRSKKSTAVTATGLLVTSAFIFEDIIGAAVMLAFSLIGLKLVETAQDYINSREFFAVAATGLVSHPFGDVFTGTPPELLFPLVDNTGLSKVVLSQDPVLNLLSIFGLEIFLGLTSLILALHLKDVPIKKSISPLVAAGGLYGFAFYLIPAPTLAASYSFVFSILGFSAVIIAVDVQSSFRKDTGSILILGLNYVLTVVVALITYVLVYLAA